VGINSVERFLGDEALRQGWQVPVAPLAKTRQPTKEEGRGGGRGVLVVGAGPSGLSAAYHLARLGHWVTIKDAGAAAGGMMRYGIPKYRLPRDILDAEITRILDMGINLELDTTVTDIQAELDAGFDAAFVAAGAHIGRRAYIPAGDSARIMDAISMLHGIEDGTPPMLGRRVAVYGGGNTAIDAARTARRLGASEAVVVYRRTREKMPAHDIEVEEALEEGVTMRWLSTVAQAEAGKLVIEKMKLDKTGFPQPTGDFEELEADCLVLALGQNADVSVLDGVPGVTFSGGVVEVGPDLMTGHPGIFAGGDMVPSERTVTVAIGHGKKAARSIDAWLRDQGGRHPQTPPRGVGAGSRAGKHAPASFGALNTWYYTDAPATVRPRLEAARRITTFDEVTGGLDESTALFEARRCMSCGNCYGVCPDNAIVKLGDGQYEIDYDYCKGCGLCVAECPCGAIEMEPEPS
jgi:2-oxoacid:acceptor oxidoreductase delta subunit (pyruvate/2-ketoisovalerate family)